jgi:hypothetical protein
VSRRTKSRGSASGSRRGRSTTPSRPQPPLEALALEQADGRTPDGENDQPRRWVRRSVVSQDYSALYRIRGVERTTSAHTTTSRWTLRFVRRGVADVSSVIEVTVPSAVFAGLDLDADYTLEQVEKLKASHGSPS